MIRQIGYELKKFFKLKYGYVYILLFILINCWSAVDNNAIRGAVYSQEQEMLLKYYYDKWGGAYNPNIENEVMIYYSETEDNNYNLFIDKVIPDDIKAEITSDFTPKTMMKLFASSFVLAKNNEKVNDVYDVRGYQVFFKSYDNIDLLFVLLTMIITSIIFSIDKQKGQEDIVKCTRYGNMAIIRAKLILICLIIVLFEAFKFSLALLPVLKSFELPSSELPLQCIANMHHVTADITIGEAMAFVVICETIGMIMANLICAFVIVANASNSEGLICGFAMAYVPYFLLEKNKLYRSVPVPSGYLVPYNFLADVQKYKMQYLLTVVLVVVVMIVICSVYTYGFRIGKRK